jgi:transcriptional regulator with XRE-family HTH domain
MLHGEFGRSGQEIPMEAAHSLAQELAPKTLGQAIARARETAGLEQEELAERVGVHEKTISRWERSVNPGVPFESVALIAKATSHSLDFFAAYLGSRGPSSCMIRDHLSLVPPILGQQTLDFESDPPLLAAVA